MKIWAYLHPELNVLYWALSEEAVPEGVEAIEFDVEDANDIIYDGIQIRLKTEAEKLAEEKQRKIEVLKRYVARLLSQTDYIILKISEVQALGDTETAEQLRQKYATQLQQREAIRQWNEQKKREIQNAQSREEIEAISLDDYPRMEE